MTKTVCDVCGKEMPTTKKFGHSIRDLNLCVLSRDKMWDICDSCHEELYKYITIYKQKEMCEKEIMVEKTENEEETNEMTRDEKINYAIKELNGIIDFEESHGDRNYFDYCGCITIGSAKMALKALEQIKKIEDIINGPRCMQGYVPKYMDICKVLEEEEEDEEEENEE